MNSKDLNKQFDAIKRQATDLVRDLHARKLAIPAGALALAIVAAMVILPQSSTPPPAPPTAATPVEQPKVARVAQVSLIEQSSIDEDIPLSSSEDPFTGSGDSYKCTTVGSNPKTLDCIVSDLKVRIICGPSGGTGPCAAKAESGASGGGTATGTGGSTGTTGAPEGGKTVPVTPKKNGSGDSGGSKVAYYVVTVKIDGSTKKNVTAGDELPSSASPLVVYAGPNDANSKAVFILADGVTAAGVNVDNTFGSFLLAKNQTVTLTDANGAEHKLTLKSINKVTK